MLDRARAHRIGPLLARQCRNGRGAAMPPSVRERLEALARASARDTLRLTAKLAAAARLLADHGILCLAYKGPTLALAAYGDLSLRSFRDIDILVRPHDVPRAKELLTSLGYRWPPEPSPRQAAAFRRASREYAGVDPDGDILEVHWDFTPPHFRLHLDLDGVWSRSRVMTLGGQAIRTPSPEDLLLVLSAHGAYHQWDRLEWIADVGALAERESMMDWDAVLERAQSAGGRRMLFVGLLLAAGLLRARMPQAVLSVARNDTTARVLVDQVRSRLFVRDPTPTVDRQRRLFHLRARERWRDRVRYLGRLALIPNQADWSAVPLPDRLSPLYYAVRPVRLVCKYLHRAFF